MALLAGAAPAAGAGGPGQASPGAQQAVDYKQLNAALLRLQAGGGDQSQTLTGYSGPPGDFPQQNATSSANPLERIGATLLAQFSRPQQAVLHGIEGRNQGLGGIIHGIMSGLAGGDHGPQLMPTNEINARQALEAPVYQQKFGGSLQSAEAQTGDIGGVKGGIADFALSTVADPLTYVGGIGPASREAKLGLKILEPVLGKDAVEQVAAKGLKSLSPDQLQAARDAFAASEQAANASPRLTTALANRFRGTPVTGAEDFTNRSMDALHQAPGITFAGQTVLPNTAIAHAAEAAKITPLARAAAATAPAQALDRNVIQPFTRRAAIVRSLGQDAADYFGRRLVANKAQSEIQINDMVRKFNHLAARVPHADSFLSEEAGPALENGTHDVLSQALRSSGETSKADLVDAAHQLRQEVTAERLASGSIRPDQLHDINTWIPHVETPEFRQHLADNPSVALDLGYRPSGAGFLRGEDAMRRAFPGTAKEANDAVRQHLGAAFTGKAFEEDPVKALTRYAAGASHTTMKVNLLRDLQKYDHEGTPIVQSIYDHESRLKDISARTAETLKPLRKDIEATKAQIAKSALLEAKTPLLAKERERALAEVERLRGLVSKTQASRFAATQAAKFAEGSGNRIAREAGLAAKRQRAKALQEFRKSVLADESASPAERAFARDAFSLANKDYQETRREVMAKASGRALNKSIGAATTKASYERRLDEMTATRLRTAERRAATAERAAYTHALRTAPAAQLRQKAASLEAHKAGVLLAARHARAAIRSQITKRPAGYQKVSYGVHGDFYAHPSVIKELDNLEQKTRDPGALRVLGDAVNASSQALKNLILNAPGVSQARVIRDNYNNLMQMWQKGFSDVTTFKPAAEITKALVFGTRNGVSRAEAVARLSPEDQEIVRLMDEQGALEVGRVSSDLKHAGVATSKGERIRQNLNPANAESYFTRFGTRFSQTSDDFSRVAMFIDQYRKTGDAAAAAKATDEALFNYSDLTRAEQGLKKAIPFYTYFARNNALQLWAITHVPQKSAAISRLQEDLANQQASGNKVLPNYALAAGDVPLFSVHGVPVVGGLQTPMGAAAQMAQPLADIASGLLPPKYQTQAGLKGGIGQLAQNLGGVPLNTAKALAEVAAGSNITTGAPIGKGQYDGYLHLLEANIPRASTYGGLAGNLAGQDNIDSLKQALGIGTTPPKKGAAPAGTENGAIQAAQLLRLLGVQAVPVTEQKQTSELARRIREVNAAADRQGTPTLSQLKKQGKAHPVTKHS